MSRDPATARARVRCNVARLDEVFPDCLFKAETVMSEDGLDAWLEGATVVCRLNRGTELVLIYLEALPEVVRLVGEEAIKDAAETAAHLSRSACGPAINPFLSTLTTVARRLENGPAFASWLGLVRKLAAKAPGGLLPLLGQVERLFAQVGITGIENWARFGLRAYRGQDHRHGDFFGLRAIDAFAALQRERHGSLFVDHERGLGLYLRALWGMDTQLRPYPSEAEPTNPRPPHIDKQGLHLPDVLDDRNGISGRDRYRAALAHMAAHLRWSKPYLADNYSVFQHLAIETFEDARVEALAIKEYPGLRRLWLALHPMAVPDACPPGWSGIRHKLAMLSRALLDPDHPYRDPILLDYKARFEARMAADPHDREISTQLGVPYLAAIHDHDFRQAKVWFKDTIVDYRDDNRYLWLFLEDAKSEDQFHSDHGAPDRRRHDDEGPRLTPSFYPEWDHLAAAYRPDWVTVFEVDAPAGDPDLFEAVLERNRPLARRVRRLMDLLKPQNRRRVRHQKDGDDLDLDLVIRARIDHLAGDTPDARLYQSHVPAGRNIAVMLLIDLSQSINEPAGDGGQTILDLAREAAFLLAWAVDALGDPLAVAGFASDTRHDVRFVRFKDFAEPWDDRPKGRIAGMEAGLSTRLGAALRHAKDCFGDRTEERRLLLVLSDGEPSDVDVDDPAHLKHDAHAAVSELRAAGITPFCITLDQRADDYVADMFGANAFTVVDRIERLPERLTRLFLSLTK